MVNMELTRKEILVMGLMSKALDDNEIAKKLKIAITTLQTHKHNIYCKLCLHDDHKSVKRVKTVLYFLEHKWELKEKLNEH